MQSKYNQTGRSMVEMLGVLAIIGVLSVGGISGYSKAMAKFKLTKAQDQITMLLMNIRTAFATSPNYDGLNNTSAVSYNIVPGDMVPGGSGSKINHAFGGDVTVKACDSAGGTTSTQYFYIQLDKLGREACVSLATSDWGTDGLVSMAVTSGNDVPTSGDGFHAAASMPVPLQTRVVEPKVVIIPLDGFTTSFLHKNFNQKGSVLPQSLFAMKRLLIFNNLQRTRFCIAKRKSLYYALSAKAW